MQTLRYPVDSKPPFGLTLLLALQHLLAALGGIIAIPLVIGNVLKLPTPDTIVLVNAALLVSGIVTIYSMPRDWPYRFAFAKRNRYQFYVRSSRTGNWF